MSFMLRARDTAEQQDNGVGLGQNEPKQEHVLATTIVTLQHHLFEGAVSVETHLLDLAFGLDKVVDDMTGDGDEGGRGVGYMESHNYCN